MTMYSTIRPRDENWFVVDECQRLEKSNQYPRFVRVFSIIFILTTIGFGSYFFFKLIVDNENLSSQLTSMKTNIKAMERKMKNTELDNKNLSSQLISLETKIESNEYTMNQSFRYLSNEIQEFEKFRNQIEPFTNYITNITAKHTRAMEEANKAWEEKFSRFLDGMNTTGKFLWKFDNYESKIGKMKETNLYYSNPFYSSQFGYKMQISCNITENCVEVGIKILVGRYDNMLEWPFKGEIILSILDHSQQPENIRVDWKSPDSVCINTLDQKNDGKVHCRIRCEYTTREYLSSRNYIRDDTLYIAAKVVQEKYFDLK